MMDKMTAIFIHAALSTPNAGKTTIGNIKATRMPVIMTEATLLNTASTPRWSEFLVESGTIRLWLML